MLQLHGDVYDRRVPAGAHTTLRHDSALGQWEMTIAAPPAALRAYVREYIGWFEHTATPFYRREPPSNEVPVVINLGAPVRIFESDDLRRWTDHDSFTTGSFDTYALVGTAGPSGGVQINFTILGARLFFGWPLADLTNRVVALEDVLGADGRRLVSRLRDAPSWETRFDILDREIAARVARSSEPSAAIAWAWRELVRTGGAARIGQLVEASGWSRRHFIARFREELGLPPKTLGRVLRFGRALAIMKTGRCDRLTDIAAACGYSDQASFTRECSEFAGVSPRELATSLLPDRGGFLIDD